MKKKVISILKIKLCLLLLFISVNNNVLAQFNNKNGFDIIKIEEENYDLKKLCSQYIRLKFNFNDSIQEIEYYKNSIDSSVFIIGYGEHSCLFIKTCNFVLPIPEGMPIINRKKNRKIKKIIKKNFSCCYSKNQRLRIVKSIYWQIDNGYKSSGYSW